MDEDRAPLFGLSLAVTSALACLRAQDAALAHAQATALVNSQATALVNAQATALVNAQASALVDQQALDDAIELPDLGTPASSSFDPAVLAPLAPLYLAYELDTAGLLRTGELVAGLFAGGALTAALEPKVAQALHDFWRARGERLAEAERTHLFAQIFDPPAFEPAMRRLCQALVALADNAGIEDVRENVGLELAAASLAEGMWPHLAGMAGFAARDVMGAINAALAFLKERSLQAAFGVHDLWSLVATTNRAQGVGAMQARAHVERGRNGMQVLRWLTDNVAAGARLDLADPTAQAVIGAAERWLLAAPDAGAARHQATLDAGGNRAFA